MKTRLASLLFNRVKKIKFGVNTSWIKYKWIEFLLDLIWIIAFWEIVIGSLYKYVVISIARALMRRKKNEL